MFTPHRSGGFPACAAEQLAVGDFGSELHHAQEREQLLDPTVGVQQNKTALEWTYRFFFLKRPVMFQSDIQHIIKPGGTGNFDNALVVGCPIGFYF